MHSTSLIRSLLLLAILGKPLTPEAPDARPLGIKFPISQSLGIKFPISKFPISDTATAGGRLGASSTN